jgi:hypothetical protein
MAHTATLHLRSSAAGRVRIYDRRQCPTTSCCRGNLQHYDARRSIDGSAGGIARRLEAKMGGPYERPACGTDRSDEGTVMR